jgi:ATP-dependent DNA ligase
MIGKTLIELQRPSEISEIELSAYLDNDKYSISQKLDGHRVVVQTGPLRCFTRQGHDRDVPASVREALGDIQSEWIFDGELLDKTYHCFDILGTSRGSVRSWKWTQRQAVLTAALQNRPGIVVVPQITTTAAKREFFDLCQSQKVEGVVFARTDAKYKPGRNLNTVKHKFMKDIDCVVLDRSINGKDNLLLGVYRDGQVVEVGKVSALTGDGPKVQIGDVVTVRVLYATNSDKLYLPVTPRIRADKSPEECSYDQITVLKTNKKPV